MASSNEDGEYFMSIINGVIEKEKIKCDKIKITNALKAGENYFGIVKKVKVTGRDHNNKEVELNLICKISPDEESRSLVRVDLFFKREVYFYVEIMPILDELQNQFKFKHDERFRFAKCFKGSAESLKEIVVLEDVGIQGFKIGNRHVSLNIEQMTLIMKNLGKYHALCFTLKKNNPEKFKEFTENLNCEDINDAMGHYVDSECDRAIDVIEDEELKGKLEVFKKTSFAQLIKCISPEVSAPYNVICHGDCWTNNFLFKYVDNSLVDIHFLDWQMIKHACPVLDLFYLIFTSTDEEFRHDHYTNVLDIYYESLKRSLVKLDFDVNICYPEKVYRQQLKDYLPFGLLIALMTLALFSREPGDSTNIKALAETTGAVQMNENSKQIYKKRITGVVKDLANWGAI